MFVRIKSNRTSADFRKSNLSEFSVKKVTKNFGKNKVLKMYVAGKRKGSILKNKDSVVISLKANNPKKRKAIVHIYELLL